MNRLQLKQIEKDIEKKLVFIVGPRQVGKTWITKELGKKFQNSLYLNYDSFEHRAIIKNHSWLKSTDLLIFDELHKMPDWKNYIKGIFDTKPDNLKIIVTGSARLDTFRQTGDSLAGRFFCHRLMPFSVSELKNTKYCNLDRFMSRGGFPEPFLTENEIDAARWRMQYIDGLIRTDILNFDEIHDFRAMNLILELLRKRVGSPISFKAISEDVQVSPNTVKKYIEILEALYIVFRVTPYSKNIARSILKEPKIYFFDTGMVDGDIGLKLENTVALSLLKSLYAEMDYEGIKTDLHYLRTKEGKEVDFCIVKNNELKELIEVKYSDDKISKNLKYFCEKYDLKGTQIVKELRNEKMVENIEIRDAEKFLKELYL